MAAAPVTFPPLVNPTRNRAKEFVPGGSPPPRGSKTGEIETRAFLTEATVKFSDGPKVAFSAIIVVISCCLTLQTKKTSPKKESTDAFYMPQRSAQTQVPDS